MQNILERLNDKQRQAVVSNMDSHSMVISGAGSGKTKVLTTRFAYLLENQKLEPKNIMAITFTNKAANELKDRLKNLLADKFDKKQTLWVSTFHSIARRILMRDYKSAGFKSINFSIIDPKEQEQIIKTIIEENIKENVDKNVNKNAKEGELSFSIIEENVDKNVNKNAKEEKLSNELKNFYCKLEEPKDFIKDIVGKINYLKDRNIRVFDYKVMLEKQEQILNEVNKIKDDIIKNNVENENSDKNNLSINYINKLKEIFKYSKEQDAEKRNLLFKQLNNENLSNKTRIIDYLISLNILENQKDYSNNEEDLIFLSKQRIITFFLENNKTPYYSKYPKLENILKQRFLLEIYSKYEKYCFEKDIVDFSELLLRSYELLKQNKYILKKYQNQFKHILIDEFQDTSRFQYKWLSLLVGENTRLFAVGDDDQSIYSWRGASENNMQMFIEQYTNSKNNVILMEQNYRCTANILNAANNVIVQNKERLYENKKLWTTAKEGEYLDRVINNNKYTEADFIANQILKLTADYPNDKNVYSNFAILYRNNSISRAIEDSLRKHKIPYETIGGLKFFEREEIKDILAYLRLALDPNNDLAFDRVINKPARKNGDKTVKDIHIYAQQNKISYYQATKKIIEQKIREKKKAPEGLIQFISIIDNIYNFAKKNNNPKKLCQYIYKETQLLEYYHKKDIINNKDQEEENKVNNLQEFFLTIENMQNNWEPEEIEDNENNYSNLTKFFKDFFDYATMDADSKKIEDNNHNKVKLMTIHKSKGLEFNNVFLAGLEADVLPSPRSQNQAEERRLMYVAITRAKNKLFLCNTICSRAKEFELIPCSEFLKDIPQNIVRTVNLVSNKVIEPKNQTTFALN